MASTLYPQLKVQMMRCNCSVLTWYRYRQKQEEKVKEGEEKMADENGEEEEGDLNEEITLTIILNRICGGKIQHPNEFWKQLGQMFKNIVHLYPDEASSYRKMSDKLRVLSYNLYKDWYSLFKNPDKDRERRILEAERVKFIELREELRKKKREEWISASEEVDFEK